MDMDSAFIAIVEQGRAQAAGPVITAGAGSATKLHLPDLTIHVEVCEDMWVPVPPSAEAALAGATVLLKGTLTGTVTDFDGNYEIQAPSAESVLVFSFTGMTEQEITVGNRSVIDVVMESSMVALDEVVVTGYGVQKKVNLSGAVDQVDIEQLESRPISNIAQGLQGASPNLNIDFNSGEPGQAAKINIRGLTSINGGEPLILIDGVPSDALELNRLAPEDVESISVLKDASSAAIYGARAAFGVILITTKTGTQDGVTVNYTTNFSTGTPTVLPNKVTDPYIYLRVLETSTDNTPWDNVNYSDETTMPYITHENRRYSQLAWYLRARTLVDIDCWSRVPGIPLPPGMIEAELRRRLSNGAH